MSAALSIYAVTNHLVFALSKRNLFSRRVRRRTIFFFNYSGILWRTINRFKNYRRTGNFRRRSFVICGRRVVISRTLSHFRRRYLRSPCLLLFLSLVLRIWVFSSKREVCFRCGGCVTLTSIQSTHLTGRCKLASRNEYE